MERVKGIETVYGIMEGRGNYLDSIAYRNETELTLIGEFSVDSDFKKYEMNFTGIVFLKSVELDFDERAPMQSFGIIENSELLQKFNRIDHSAKLKSTHKHYYFRTYDTVFEIVAEDYDLKA